MDRAVHIFDIEGNPLQTIFGGGRDTSYMASLNDVEVVHGGLIVVGNLSRSIAVFDDSGVVSAFTPDLPVPDAVLGARLAGGDHVVYEHWFALNSQQNTNEWRGLPLVRAFDLDGKLLYTHGAIGEHDGRNLAQALERGTIATNHDTLWFAQKSTGLLRAYVIGYDEPVREVQLPHFFRANPPRELEAATGRLNAVVEEHVGNFSVDGLGRFWIVQNTGYPSDPDALFRPDQVLSVYGSDGSHLASYDFGLEVLAAVSVGRTQFVVLRDPAPWIRVFRLTLDLPSDGRDCSSVRPA